MQRRLAAIVHADLAGFTRMMEGAETRTFRHLKSAQIEVWRPAIDAGNGRLVGTAGDAMLAEFGSAVTAVGAAIDIQERMARFNEALSVEQRMLFRGGVHLGEVIVARAFWSPARKLGVRRLRTLQRRHGHRRNGLHRRRRGSHRRSGSGLAYGRRCTRWRRRAQWGFGGRLHHACRGSTGATRGDRDRWHRGWLLGWRHRSSAERCQRALRNRRARRGATRGNAALIEHHAFDGAVGLIVRSAGHLCDGKPQLFEIDRVVDRALHLEWREARTEQLQTLGCGREDAFERDGGAGSSA